MPKLAKKYLNNTLDQVRKMFLLGGSGSLLIFILLVTFISIYIERREVAQLVKNEEKEQIFVEGFINKYIVLLKNRNLQILLVIAVIAFAVFCVVMFIIMVVKDKIKAKRAKIEADKLAAAGKRAWEARELAKQAAAAAKRAAAT